ncbi:MAG: hypothetical protein JWO94_3950, partial [Verrucomicrobiaceae bacterium]|nr:hypothetical protein [Verrucomicrobiaceae bacterium]
MVLLALGMITFGLVRPVLDGLPAGGFAALT